MRTGVAGAEAGGAGAFFSAGELALEGAGAAGGVVGEVRGCAGLGFGVGFSGGGVAPLLGGAGAG
jgi:hypothetical protein